MKVRKVRFDLQDKLSIHYFKGNAFSTHLANSLNVIFPEGEKFFIRSCRKFLDRIDDPELKKEVLLFIGQEGTHSTAHRDIWQYLEEQGLKVGPYAKFIDKIGIGLVEKGISRLMGEDRADRFFLSMTAGLEHYTALLAEVAFENEDEFRNMPEEMRQLWFWHASEEIEHKSVAFDLLKYIDDDPVLKNSGFTLATILLLSFAFGGQMYFVATDKESRLKDWPAEIYDFMKSLGRPMARKFFGNALKYYRSDYHPSQMKNDHWAEEFFSQNTRYTADTAG